MSPKAPMRYRPDVEVGRTDEAAAIQKLDAAFREVLDTTSQDNDHAVRAVHAKAHAVLAGTMVIEPGLPPELAQGVFAESGEHRVLLRVSTNAGDILPDTIGLPWLNDGSCVRLRPARPNPIWSYDFMETRTHDGRKVGMLDVMDELTRECLAIRVARKLKGTDVIDVLSDLFNLRGVPSHVRSDNGPEFVAKAVQSWIPAVGAKTAFIAPGSPWENGYVESFNSKLRDERLNGEIFYTLKEAKIVIGGWRKHHATPRPHSSLGYMPPAPEVVLWPAAQPRPAPPATPSRRAHAHKALTFNPNHLMGAS